MAIADDISVAANGDIRRTGTAHGTATAGYYTVIEFHRFLQDLADDAVSSPDDLLDITSLTPSDRSTDNIITLINGYNIDDDLAEYLFDGSIIQADGDTIYDGLQVIAGEGMNLQIVQNGAVIVNDFWNTIPDGETTPGLNRDSANGISHRFMVKVRDAGADIDGRRILGQTREWGFTYSEFRVNGTNRGNNVLALTFQPDNNNQTLIGTIAGYTDIVNNNEGYVGLDINNDTVDEFFYSQWTLGSRTINDFYERAKWLTRTGGGQTLYGLDSEIFRGITHEFDIDSPSGTFNAFEPISWASGTGQMLAIDSPTAGTKMWIQLLTGVLPSNNDVITGGTSSATAQLNVTITERTVSLPFSGASTGSAIIGAYGLGIEPLDLSAADTLRDLTDNSFQPPNFVTFTVGGLVASSDRVLVGPESGGTLQTSQFTLNGALSGGEATVTINGAIPTDTPATGTIRIFDGTSFVRVTYTGFSGSDFTGCVGTPAAANGADVFISYIDVLASATTESFTSVYSADRSLFIRVRNGTFSPVIKTFESTGTLGAAGGSSTAIRTADE